MKRNTFLQVHKWLAQMYDKEHTSDPMEVADVFKAIREVEATRYQVFTITEETYQRIQSLIDEL